MPKYNRAAPSEVTKKLRALVEKQTAALTEASGSPTAEDFQRQWLPVERVAECYPGGPVSPSTVKRHWRLGVGPPYVKIGRTRLVHESWMPAWVAAQLGADPYTRWSD